MKLENHLNDFIQYCTTHGEPIHCLKWQASPDSVYGVFAVNHESPQDALSQEQAEHMAAKVTAAWQTWMYCRNNPFIPEDMALMAKSRVREILNKIKEVVAARDDLLRIVKQRESA